MSKPKVIIFDSPDPKAAYRAAIAASTFCGDHQLRPQFATFTDIVSENVNRFFALPLSKDGYKDKMNEELPDFLGYSPNGIYELFNNFMIEKFGKAYFGRMMARRLHRDNITGVYLIHENTYPESLLAVANEVGIANMLIISLSHPTAKFDADDPIRDMSGYETNTILNGIRKINLPVVPTPELTRLVIHGSIREFLGVKENT